MPSSPAPTTASGSQRPCCKKSRRRQHGALLQQKDTEREAQYPPRHHSAPPEKAAMRLPSQGAKKYLERSGVFLATIPPCANGYADTPPTMPR